MNQSVIKKRRLITLIKEKLRIFSDQSQTVNVSPESLLAKTTNPYIAARTEWNFMFADHIKAKRNWQLMAVGMLMINSILVMGLISLSLKSTYIPYAIKVDAMGNANFSGFLQAEQPISPLEMNAFIRRYITNARSVIGDSVAEKQALDFVYTTTRGQGVNVINEHYRAKDPFNRAKDATTEVQVNTVMQKSSNTWQVEWTEIDRNLDGAGIGQSRYEALVTVKHYPVTNEKEINMNPLGLYISNLSWATQS